MSIPTEKRKEINRKRSESYQRKKGQPPLLKPIKGDTTYYFIPLSIYTPYTFYDHR